MARKKVKEKIEIAKKCLQKGMSISDIAELTGLSKEKLQSIHEHLERK